MYRVELADVEGGLLGEDYFLGEDDGLSSSETFHDVRGTPTVAPYPYIGQ